MKNYLINCIDITEKNLRSLMNKYKKPPTELTEGVGDDYYYEQHIVV